MSMCAHRWPSLVKYIQLFRMCPLRPCPGSIDAFFSRKSIPVVASTWLPVHCFGDVAAEKTHHVLVSGGYGGYQPTAPA